LGEGSGGGFEVEAAVVGGAAARGVAATMTRDRRLLHLADPNARRLTGQVLTLDGGLELR
ncbi:hypothetical protein, partial [Kribbella turkmenica]|uniref:hypothetical protein n=1 Tax=Kribbella turkmenica TaxID=2530375 RepID=UPI001F423E74